MDSKVSKSCFKEEINCLEIESSFNLLTAAPPRALADPLAAIELLPVVNDGFRDTFIEFGTIEGFVADPKASELH